MAKELKIHITLPRDRRKPGIFRLLDMSDRVLFDAPCLGKADNARAAREGNPTRDPKRPYGDTPTGDYAPARVWRLDPPHRVMGPLVIELEGASGDALQARINGRRGLAIHGGRGDARLVATLGCIRLRDKSMAEVARLCGDATLHICIEEAPEHGEEQ